jgi:hypothetical protein
MTKSLSPAAQTILDAFRAVPNLMDGPSIAGALRAAADQVVPEPPMIVEGGRTYEEAWTATVHDYIRRQLLAIASELESLPDE